MNALPSGHDYFEAIRTVCLAQKNLGMDIVAAGYAIQAEAERIAHDKPEAGSVADVIQFLRTSASTAMRAANDYAAFGRIGSDEAEALAVPAREHAQYLATLAQTVAQLDAAARAVFAAKGRHHTQLAMCHLGDLLGIETTRP